jgi:uncharacterized protein YjiS (DUF1127 family)
MTKRPALVALRASWRRWRLNQRTRDELHWLSDRDLADIGFARDDVARFGRG